MKNFNFTTIVLFIVTTICLLILTTNSNAATPNKCPNTAIIQDTSFDLVTTDPHTDTYDAFQLSKENYYDTNVLWGFAIFDIKASSEDGAFQKAKDSLSKLSFDHGPVKVSEHLWKCYYNVPEGYEVVAVTNEKTNTPES